jgi:FkbM family methyltransferase
MKDALKFIFKNWFVFKIFELQKKHFPNKKQKYIIEQKQNFYSSFINKNDLCFDIGANMGNRIEPLLEIGAKIVAVEPQKICYTFLQKKFGNKIEIITKGLGDSEGFEKFYVSNANTLSSFSADWINAVKLNRFKKNNWNKVVKIEITTLDNLIEKYGIPKFIKIDVEGYELNVLNGLTKAINLICYEYTVPEQTEKLIHCLERIEQNYSKIECNYSIGESMKFALQKWLSKEEMKFHINTNEFLNSDFGDIYVRIKN